MANIKFFYDNLIKIYTPTETSQHENFPVENLQHRDFNKAWRSRYGAGSGWGNFVITDSVNDRLDIDEGGGEFSVVITPGTYDADTLATMIGSQMTATSLAVGNAWTYVCSYDDATNKFTIEETSGPNNFSILWKTGTHGSDGTGRTVGYTIGFSEAADDAGAATFTADYVRIHSSETITIDFVTPQDIYGVIIRGHNLEGAAAVSVLFSTDNFATVSETIPFTFQDNILILEWDTPKTYQYSQIRIRDWTNSALYVAMGIEFIGPQFQPVTNNLQGPDLEDIDPSIVMESEAGQESSLQGDQYEVGTYVFRVNGAAEVANFKAMRDAVGTSKALFVCEDPTSDATARATTKYIRFTSWKWTPLKQSVNRWQLVLGYKELR